MKEAAPVLGSRAGAESPWDRRKPGLTQSPTQHEIGPVGAHVGLTFQGEKADHTGNKAYV